MSDPIMTRKEAREYIIKHCNPHRDTGTQWDDAMECAIKALEEPEQKKGKWDERKVFDTEDSDIAEMQSAKCSACGKYHTTPYLYFFDNFNFCPNCGTYMIYHFEHCPKCGQKIDYSEK